MRLSLIRVADWCFSLQIVFIPNDGIGNFSFVWRLPNASKQSYNSLTWLNASQTGLLLLVRSSVRPSVCLFVCLNESAQVSIFISARVDFCTQRLVRVFVFVRLNINYQARKKERARERERRGGGGEWFQGSSCARSRGRARGNLSWIHLALAFQVAKWHCAVKKWGQNQS